MRIDLESVLHWHIPTALWWVVGPFLLWRVGLRIHRLLARQEFSKNRFWMRATSLGVLTLVVGSIAYEEKTAFLSLLAGLGAGAVLGAIGTRFTSLHYRQGATTVSPDRVTGVALSALLVGRIVWRLLMGSSDAISGWTMAEFVRNPSTMVLFGLFTAHYFVYALGVVGLVRHRRGS